MVVVARLYWFQQRLKTMAATERGNPDDLEANCPPESRDNKVIRDMRNPQTEHTHNVEANAEQDTPRTTYPNPTARSTTITFGDKVPHPRSHQTGETVLHVPGPRDRDDGKMAATVLVTSQLNVALAGHSMIEIDEAADNDDGQSTPCTSDRPKELAWLLMPEIDAIRPVESSATGLSRRRPHNLEGPAMRAARSMEKVASSILVLGHGKSSERESHRLDLSTRRRTADLPQLSRQVTIGRNSQFFHLTERDRELLGGIEYRSLKLLLKIVSSYFLGLHLLGVICLLPWIMHAPYKYTAWLAENGQGRTWWAFYSAQTMVDNLGFTLTPDSMATFKDATWPMLVMTFLAFAGNTCYPVLLRLVIWAMSKVVNKKSATKEHLQFLLDHPRRCYTLLFPSRPTWILFGIVFVLNFIDVLLIIVLDLDNPAVNDLAMGPRILSALFQAASARHTGTATLNLSLVNPAVQFSLLCMMSNLGVFPIAISIRASNTYEERALGVYGASSSHLDENNGYSYVMAHIRNQLSFDLWYIFLGTFCICIAESQRIMDLNEPLDDKLLTLDINRTDPIGFPNRPRPRRRLQFFNGDSILTTRFPSLSSRGLRTLIPPGRTTPPMMQTFAAAAEDDDDNDNLL
ncbi:putative low-affinity potassium transport protein [Colletotrichum sublineola]|uniref:Putative low-affinity potassium transport protein n=1 Tax=Colletotrichum sublineola TaxID=1173701 RepID=A0A066WV32_COLSU|nr:putative low-affinity potassium transport protein [Colletotrichum sublineola]